MLTWCAKVIKIRIALFWQTKAHFCNIFCIAFALHYHPWLHGSSLCPRGRARGRCRWAGRPVTTPGEVSLITCNRSTRLSRLQPGGRRCWARYGRRCWRLGRFLDELKCRQRFLLFDTGLCRNQESEVPIINLSPWQKVHTVVFLFQSIHLLLTKLAYEHRNHFEVTIRFDFDNYFYEIKTRLELLVVKLFNVTVVFLIEDCRFCTVEASNFEPCRNFSFFSFKKAYQNQTCSTEE